MDDTSIPRKSKLVPMSASLAASIIYHEDMDKLYPVLGHTVVIVGVPHTTRRQQHSSPTITMSSTVKPKPNPLPLEDTLRDLALIRAFEVDLASVLASSTPVHSAPSTSSSPNSAVDDSVTRSYEFAKAAREAMRIQNRGSVDKQGERVEEVRARLAEVGDVLERNAGVRRD